MVIMCFQETTTARALIPRLKIYIRLGPGYILLTVAQRTNTVGGLFLFVGISREPCGFELGQSSSVLLGLAQVVPVGRSSLLLAPI